MSSHQNDRHKSWLTHEKGPTGQNNSVTGQPATADYVLLTSARGTPNRHYCPECGTVRTAYGRGEQTFIPPHKYHTGGQWDTIECDGGRVDPVEDKAP